MYAAQKEQDSTDAELRCEDCGVILDEKKLGLIDESSEVRCMKCFSQRNKVAA